MKIHMNGREARRTEFLGGKEALCYLLIVCTLRIKYAFIFIYIIVILSLPASIDASLLTIYYSNHVIWRCRQKLSSILHVSMPKTSSHEIPDLPLQPEPEAAQLSPPSLSFSERL